MDFVLSIGVLHHIPDPAPVFPRRVFALRPGGRMAVWLYGREGNAAYLAAVRPLRAITRRLPHPVLAGIVRVPGPSPRRLHGRLPLRPPAGWPATCAR